MRLQDDFNDICDIATDNIDAIHNDGVGLWYVEDGHFWLLCINEEYYIARSNDELWEHAKDWPSFALFAVIDSMLASEEFYADAYYLLTRVMMDPPNTGIGMRISITKAAYTNFSVISEYEEDDISNGQEEYIPRFVVTENEVYVCNKISKPKE